MTNHLLERYVTLGIRLTADNGRLEIDAPDGILTPGLVDELKRNKPALLAALTAPKPAPGIRRNPPPSPGRPVFDSVPDNWPEQTGDDLGDLLPADGSWDSLPVPTPCPTCGGIDCWWGLWDERHCPACEPARQRSLLLADRAARLRARR